MRALVILLISLLSSVNLLLATPLEINNKTDIYYIGKYSEYIIDKEDKLNFNSIKNKKHNWKKVATDHFSYGYVQETYWFRFKLKNSTKKIKKMYFELDDPLIDYLSFYIPQKKGKYKKIITGDHFPFKKRDIQTETFVFELSIPPGTYTYYIQIKSILTGMEYLPILWTPRAFIKKSNERTSVLWAYLGIMMIMIIYNMFIYFSTWDRNYLYYILFLISWLLLVFTTESFGLRFLWPKSLWWNHFAIIFANSNIIIWSCMFFRSFLNIKQNYKVFNRILLYSLILPNIIIPIILCFYNKMIIIKTGMIFSVYLIIILLYISIYCAVKRNRQAYFLLAAFVFVYIGAGATLLKNLGIIQPIFFTEWGIHISSTFLVLIFSFALADKLNVMKNELKNLNLNLEKLVRQRTRKLKNTNKILHSTQAQLIQSEKLAGLGQLAAGIAHEVNNPLGYIINNLNVLKDYLKKLFKITSKYQAFVDSNSKYKKQNQIFSINNYNHIKKDTPSLIKETLEGSQKVKQIISNLKNFAQPSFDRKQIIDINEEINRSLDLIKITIKSNYKIKTDLGKISYIMGNRNQINQVIINILTNSIDATKYKIGIITIKTYEEKNSIIVSISDNGIGIPVKNKNKIFDPFFTTKEIGKGTGLGLSTVYGIIKSHKGTIKMSSKKNKGTTFMIKLPITTQKNKKK